MKPGDIDNVRLSDDGLAVRIIDQTLLPGRTEYLELRGRDELWEAIYSLRVRGAPAIGVFAGYAMYALAASSGIGDTAALLGFIADARTFLDSSRPTAVNLSAMTRRMHKLALSMKAAAPEDILAAMRREAEAIQAEDAQMCLAISEYGLSLLHDGDCVLTHCNAGPLATSKYGTGLGPILLAKERGVNISAYCDETRPLLQGARLTVYELMRAGVDCTLICDSMASCVMAQGRIQAVLVGCDRVAANGDTANKIGTSGLAVLAKHYGIPFYVLGPSSTIDLDCPDGRHIPIEERQPEEIFVKFYSEPTAPAGTKCYNPAFDVTDNSLITAIITERGICRAPFRENLAALFKEKTK